MKRIILGADKLGFSLKETMKSYLETKGYQISDINPDAPLDYFVVGAKVGQAISEKRADLGMAFCATGMGPSIVANKFKGVYAAVVESGFTAERCRVVNNANVLTMGQQVLTPEKAMLATDKWLDAKFGEGCGFDDLKAYLADCLLEVQKIENANMK